jgi:hypothetical protein
MAEFRQLRLKDLDSMLLNSHTEKVLAAFHKEADDQEVAQIWTGEQEAVIWKAYRKSCLKEARQAVKVEKAVCNGDWASRKPRPPKPIKDHAPFPPLILRDYEFL